MTAAPRLRFSATSHVGRVRSVNEDAILSLPGRGLWVVSDGMGGHEAGDVASRIVTDSVAMLPDAGSAAGNMSALRKALHDAHAIVRDEALSRGGVTMGATVVALLVSAGHFVCFWVGDSRLYRLREGRLDLLTHDHSIVGDLVARGDLTWDEAEAHPQSNAITRAVGVGDVLDPGKVRGQVAPGDRFILCTDGLNKHLSLAEIAAHATRDPIETVSEELVSGALDRGGTDNVSVIVVDIAGA